MSRFTKLAAAISLFVAGSLCGATVPISLTTSKLREWSGLILAPDFLWPEEPVYVWQIDYYDNEIVAEVAEDSEQTEPDEDDDEEYVDDGTDDTERSEESEEDDEAADMDDDNDEDIDDSESEAIEEERQPYRPQINITLPVILLEDGNEGPVISPRLLVPRGSDERSYNRQPTVSLSPLERPTARNVMISGQLRWGEPAPASNANVVDSLEEQVRD